MSKWTSAAPAQVFNFDSQALIDEITYYKRRLNKNGTIFGIKPFY
jgi:hypothetical protein